ncbi:MAG: T9SS type A sorting domain-containing protein [Flavobacteriales bacterium]|jgi:hypothetical protein
MRTSIITAVCALLMVISGTAQTIVEAEGFFDTDPGVGNGIPLGNNPTGSATSINGNLPLSISSGFHAFYVRCKASTNLWSNARGRTVFVSNTANQQPVVQEIVACEYFIDTDPGVGNGVDVPVTASPTLASVFAAVATSQTPGVHQVGVRFKASGGMWSNSRMRSFIVRRVNDTPVADQIIAAEYFFDTDPGVGNGNDLAVDTPGLSVSLTSSMAVNLTPGTHQLYVRVKSDIGYWSNARGRTVIVTEGSLLPTIHYIDAAEYYIDTDPGQGNGTAIAVPTATTVDIDELLDASSIAVGVHQLYIRVRSDQNIWSDFAVQEFTVTSDTQPVFTLQALNPLCAGTNSGTIEVTTVGGTPPFSYAWDGVVGNDTLFNAAAGPHQLIVSDGTSAIVLDTIITLVAPEAITYSLSSADVSCFGGNDGNAEVVASGGVGNYLYDWNGFDPAQLIAGVYFFSVTDGNGCDVSGSVSITQPDAIAASVSVTPVSASGACDGSAEVTITGGTAPFTIQWNDPNASIGSPITGLCEGEYIAAIADANGCLGQSEAAVISTGLIEHAGMDVHVTISPNPSEGIFKVNLTSAQAGEMLWTVTDSRGRLVNQAPLAQTAGFGSTFTIDLSGMAQGLYHLNIGFNGNMSSHRLMLTGSY